MSKTEQTIVHVTGTTQEEVSASFLVAKAHYTPKGEKAPSKGIMNRLYKEAGALRAQLADAEAEAATPVTPARPGTITTSSHEVDSFLAETPKPRSAAGAKAAQEKGKVVDINRRNDRNRQAADQAAATVDRAIAQAKAAADDPYRTAMRNRREADRKRGPGRKISDEDLTALIASLTTAHPDYRVGQVWEVCMWTEKLAISKSRFDTAWRAATGTEPTRRPLNRKAG